jgi:flagellar basal body rod protein FlgG
VRPQFSLMGLLIILTFAGAACWNFSPPVKKTVIEKTGRMLDLAIVGDGYFELQHLDGQIVYCRSGRFGINNDGLIAHEPTGFVVNPSITIPRDQTDIEVTSSGEVRATNRQMTEKMDVGRLSITRFPFESKLLKSDNCYFLTDASGTPYNCHPGEFNTGHLAQGWLEQETARWTFQDALPILILLLCAATLGVQLWVSATTYYSTRMAHFLQQS